MSTWERDPTTGNLNLISGMRSLTECKDLLLNICYPVGTVYTSTNNVSPETFLGGTWTQIKDTFLLTAGDTYVAGATGGSKDAKQQYHTHTVNGGSHRHGIGHWVTVTSGGNYVYQGGAGTGMDPSQYTNYDGGHTHTVSAVGSSTDQGYTDANMPPYKVVYAWERTA